ncbi:Cation/H+ exchanger [Dillenia turbinata]|uniref:Cation/H+ exchanger n=1 Tax=Dillenia turbinata TaxID=194707 RepID=A0AAN8W3Y8_9MAGN
MGFDLGSAMMKIGILSSSDDYFYLPQAITLFVALLCFCNLIGHLAGHNPWLNRPIICSLIGLLTRGAILLKSKGESPRLLEFNEELFFIYLLPPIIFNAGFQVKKKQFFRNFMTIMSFGAMGTLISFVIIYFGCSCFSAEPVASASVIGLKAKRFGILQVLQIGAFLLFKKLDIGFLDMKDYLALGAIFSATDSVCILQVLRQDETPLLHSLVFGEGVVNDATSIVLFNAIQKFDLSHIKSTIVLKFIGNFMFLFVTSTCLGILVGLLSAYIIRKLYFGRHSTDREVALMGLLAYLSYMIAELFYLSGILTVFFCGIVMSHYTWHNITKNSRVATKHLFAALSECSEDFIFVYVGMDALDIEKWSFVRSPWTSLGVSSVLFSLVLIGRAAFIFPISFLSNWTKKAQSDKVELKQQVTIWWAGLMRGAVSVALAYSQFAKSGHTSRPGNAIMITSTITVVLFSTVVLGLVTKPLVRVLLPPLRRFNSQLSSEPSSPKSITLPLLANGQDPSEAGGGITNIVRPTSLRMLLATPSHTVHHYWRTFDDSYMRPVFGGRGFVPVPGSSTERNEEPQLQL